jgi:hypothetical protein
MAAATEARMKRVATISLALLALTAIPAAAQEPQEYKVTVLGEMPRGSTNDHFLTFSGPFQIPEVTLPAGTYVFTIVAPSVVRVSSADRSQYYATFFTIPVMQLDPGDQYSVVLARIADGSAPRITKWFLPNQEAGYEFRYPKAELVGER